MEKEPRETKKPKAWVEYGSPGHESEYVFSTEQLPGEDSVSYEIADVIETELGPDWDIAHRTTRIEVRCKKPYGARDDEKINAAFRKALGEKYDFSPAS